MRAEDEEDPADLVEDVFVADHDAGSVGYVAARVAEHRTAPHRTAPQKRLSSPAPARSPGRCGAEGHVREEDQPAPLRGPQVSVPSVHRDAPGLHKLCEVLIRLTRAVTILPTPKRASKPLAVSSAHRMLPNPATRAT
jgi:hypothetical protein